MDKTTQELLRVLQYVLDADKYDGALTLGTAALSPAIRALAQRTIDEAKATLGAAQP